MKNTNSFLACIFFVSMWLGPCDLGNAYFLLKKEGVCEDIFSSGGNSDDSDSLFVSKSRRHLLKEFLEDKFKTISPKDIKRIFRPLEVEWLYYHSNNPHFKLALLLNAGLYADFFRLDHLILKESRNIILSFIASDKCEMYDFQAFYEMARLGTKEDLTLLDKIKLSRTGPETFHVAKITKSLIYQRLHPKKFQNLDKVYKKTALGKSLLNALLSYNEAKAISLFSRYKEAYFLDSNYLISISYDKLPHFALRVAYFTKYIDDIAKNYLIFYIRQFLKNIYQEVLGDFNIQEIMDIEIPYEFIDFLRRFGDRSDLHSLAFLRDKWYEPKIEEISMIAIEEILRKPIKVKK